MRRPILTLFAAVAGFRFSAAAVRSITLAALLLALSALGSAPSVPSSQGTGSGRQAEVPVPWATSADSLAVAGLDIEQSIAANKLRPEDLPFTRWVFNPDPAATEDYQALAHAFGLITNAASLELAPGIVARPITRGIVARIDLRWYFPDPDDLARALRIWEDFANDPSFSMLFTQDQLKLLSLGQRQSLRVPMRKPGRVWNEKAWRWEGTGKPEMTFTSLADYNGTGPVVKVNPPLLVAAGLEQLQVATLSAAPIVSLDYFIGRSVAAIKRSPSASDADKKKDTTYDTIFGGRYHELANTPRSTIKGVSDLDALLGFLRIGDGKQNFAKVLDGLRSHCRTVLIRSQVTGKRRLVVMVYSPSGNPAVAAPLLAITFDIRDEDTVEIKADALLSFVASISFAHEVIWLDATGMQRFALYNADGALVDEVPIDVATDDTIPAPNTKRLDIHGCVRCHGQHAGYQPLRNDLRDIFRHEPEQLLSLDRKERDKVAGWHAGDVGKPLSRARDDYSAAVLTMTGRWKGDPGQANTVRFSSARIAAIYAREKYDMVDAAEALRRLGMPDPPNGQELAEFRRLLPKIEVAPGVFVLDDIRGLPALRAGKSITPIDFALQRSFIQERLPERQAARRQPGGQRRAVGRPALQ